MVVILWDGEYFCCFVLIFMFFWNFVFMDFSFEFCNGWCVCFVDVFMEVFSYFEECGILLYWFLIWLLGIFLFENEGYFNFGVV